MKRRDGSRARPPIPDWVLDEEDGYLEWLDENEWHIFEWNDAAIKRRQERLDEETPDGVSSRRQQERAKR